MSTKTLGRPKADPERDLRRDLLATSRELLDEGGPGALSLREVARRAGCTHQAPYHYFADRESILAALVAEGFDELAQRLRAANDLSDSGGVRAALEASGAAYVDFALARAGVFRIMFRPDVCNPARFPDVQQAGSRAKAELTRLAAIIRGGSAPPELATLLWAHVHGLACLLVDGPLAQQFPSDAARSQHLAEVGRQFADLMVCVPASGSPP
jgi:AcrR family transcriptional regulator